MDSRGREEWATSKSYQNCNSYYINPPRRMKPYDAAAQADQMSSMQIKAGRAGYGGCACRKAAARAVPASTRRAAGGSGDGKRRQRVAQYKSYAVEARMKASLKNGLLWFKHKYMQVRYGWSF